MAVLPDVLEQVALVGKKMVFEVPSKVESYLGLFQVLGIHFAYVPSPYIQSNDHFQKHKAQYGICRRIDTVEISVVRTWAAFRSQGDN